MEKVGSDPHIAIGLNKGVKGFPAGGSSGSSGRVRGGPRNMKSMGPLLAAIFCMMTYFHRAGGALPDPLMGGGANQ